MQSGNDGNVVFPENKNFPVWEQPVPTGVPWSTPLNHTLRLKLALTAIVFPVCCLVQVIGGAKPSTGQLWQSDMPHVYIALLLSSPAFLMFLPVIGYSLVGMAVWCLRPNTSCQFSIRLALYTGFLSTLIFSCLLMYITFIIGPIAALIAIGITAFLGWLIPWIIRKSKRFTILGLMITTTVVAILLMICMNNPEVGWQLTSLPFMGDIFAVAAAPFVACISFARASIAAAFINSVVGKKRTSISLVVIGGTVTAWLGMFALNWKLAIDVMMDEYYKLPLQDPSNCFVCSAAAHGHRKFVGSKLQFGFPVNKQMQRLKLLEFAMQFACPRIHCCVRVVYNRVGPLVARLCGFNRWTADAIYLCLKPLECIAISLQQILSVSNNQLDQVFRRPCPPTERTTTITSDS